MLKKLLLAGAAGCGSPESELEEAPAPEVSEVESPLTQVTSFGSNPGNLLMFRHVPTDVPANAPLVVVLHGGTQTASAYEAAGWTALANVRKFYVVYPEQKTLNNSSRCFNWFELGDIARG